MSQTPTKPKARPYLAARIFACLPLENQIQFIRNRGIIDETRYRNVKQHEFRDEIEAKRLTPLPDESLTLIALADERMTITAGQFAKLNTGEREEWAARGGRIVD